MLEEIHKSFQKQTVISESLFVEMRFEKKTKECQNNSIDFCIQLLVKKLKSVKIILLTFVFNYRLMSNYQLDLLINHGM
jgi:hypothetical protein